MGSEEGAVNLIKMEFLRPGFPLIPMKVAGREGKRRSIWVDGVA